MEQSNVPGGDVIESRSDIQLVGRAVKEEWPMSTDERTTVVKRLLEIVNNPNSTAREVTSASRVLGELNKQNKAAEPDNPARVLMDLLRTRIEQK